MSNEEITDILIEKTALSPAAAVLMARLSGGLPGKALALAMNELLNSVWRSRFLVRALASGTHPGIG